MKGLNGHRLYIPHGKRLVIPHQVDFYGRGSRVPVIVGKDIIKSPSKGIHYALVGIYGDVALPEKIRPDIIDAGRMVCMLMGEQDPIEPDHLIGEHLLPEIGAAIYYEIVVFPGNQNGYPKPLITRVRTLADRVVTPNNRDSLRCASAQKRYFQPLICLNQIYNLFI